MDSSQRTHISVPGMHPVVRIGLIALIESPPGPGGGQSQNSREAMDALASQLEPFLNALRQESRHGGAGETRTTLAVLHWQSGGRDRNAVVPEPVSLLDLPDGDVRTLAEAGLIPLLRQVFAPGFIPEGSRRPLDTLGDVGRSSNRATPTRSAGLAEPLSERELEVLHLLAAGLSNKEIAAELFLSVGTVKQHLHHINGKLDTNSRTSAIARARNLRIL